MFLFFECSSFAVLDDMQDTLTLSEYAHDIYTNMRSTELTVMASPLYMTRQRDINARMREILVDWSVYNLFFLVLN